MDWLHNNRATVIAGIVVIVVLVAVLVAFGPWRGTAGGGRVAVVHDGAGDEHRLPLDAPATLEVTTGLGRNVVVVEQGAVRITEADCPKGSCMHQRPISKPGEQIVCLPHQLWIEITDGGTDGAGNARGSNGLDTNAVSWDDETDFVSR